MEALANARDDVFLRKVDIVSWGSPVAKQFGLNSIPHLVLYEDGREVQSGVREVLAKLPQ